MKRILFAGIFLLNTCIAMAQDKKITRIARITVDSMQLKVYTQLLKEQMETAVKIEPGVISYKVYADKMHPYIITIVEVYADNDAYLLHRETPHFKKYKSATKDMVKSLELTEVVPVLTAGKEKRP